uniref:hypothetical protein n=1 Tax=Thaumasiovibrio occultus TaxID=1891184 RepID=UPI000B35B653|nr:hypothetical protein [Thaumasiovibrio occultus]
MALLVLELTLKVAFILLVLFCAVSDIFIRTKNGKVRIQCGKCKTLKDPDNTKFALRFPAFFPVVNIERSHSPQSK